MTEPIPKQSLKDLLVGTIYDWDDQDKISPSAAKRLADQIIVQLGAVNNRYLVYQGEVHKIEDLEWMGPEGDTVTWHVWTQPEPDDDNEE